MSVSTASKKLTIRYEEGEDEVARSWAYEAKPGGLELREGVFGAPFFVKRTHHRVAAAVKSSFEAWEHANADDLNAVVDHAPSVDIASLPLEAQRAEYWFSNEWGYDTQARRITVGGTKYYALSQMHDGGGEYLFFTLAGDYTGAFGGSEGDNWRLSWNEY